VNLVSAGLVLSRFAQFAAVIVVFGCGAFRIYALGSRKAVCCPPALAAFDAWYARVTAVGAIIVLLSGLTWLLTVTASMSGSAVAALEPDTVAMVLADTEYGRVWCFRLLLTALLGAASLASRRRGRMTAIFALSSTLLISLGWVGHTAIHQGAARLGHELNQMIHLLAAGLWLGGLAPLAWLLRNASTAAWMSLAREVLPRFSRMGYFAVALLAITGALNTLMLVAGVEALVGTAYGRLLGLKILLYLGMFVLAVINRLRLVPRLCHEPQRSAPIRALACSAVAEQALGFAVLAVVSILGTWPPAMTGHAG
jgi:putative copper resistance protein D